MTAIVLADEAISSGSGTADDPWRLKTPPLSSDYTMHRDERDGKHRDPQPRRSAGASASPFLSLHA